MFTLLKCLVEVFIGITMIASDGCCHAAKLEIRTETACYGIYNNYLRLRCSLDKVITVLEVNYGVKVNSAHCASPSNVDNYNQSCCVPEITDCIIPTTIVNVMHFCNGQSSCNIVATWSITGSFCNQENYGISSHYMMTTYICDDDVIDFNDRLLKGTSTPMPTTSSKSTTTSSVTTVTNLFASGKYTEAIKSHEGENNKSLSGSMVGAIIGGSVGMLVTLVLFLLYWGRKRRLRIGNITKPEPNVWDFLLSQTATVRGFKGYDYVSVHMSSTSSETDTLRSPSVRGNRWLPNISPHDDNCSDITSNYDNDYNKEIYYCPSPRPSVPIRLTKSQHH